MHDQFLYGADMMVAPVIEPGAVSRQLVLPGDQPWRHLWSGQMYDSGVHTVPAPLGQPPVFVRPDSEFAELFATLPGVLAA